MERFTRRLLSKMVNLILAVAVLITMTAINANAELKSLSDSELSAVYAEGFSNFTITDLGTDLFGNTHTETLAELNIHAYTYTTIESLKLGHYNNSQLGVSPATTDWDQNWENVVIGQSISDPTTDLKAEGVYFKAEFENIDNPATRELKSITFGAKSVTGDISADFIKFSGTIDDGDGFPEYDGTRLNLGSRTITATASDFSLTLSLDKGYWVNFDNAIVQPRLY